MRRKARNYSIIIVSDATASSKDFTLSAKFIKNAVVAISILLLLFGFIIYDYLTISFNKEKMKRMESDGVQKDRTIAELSSSIEALQKNLNKMKEYEKKINIAAGLTSPYALKEVGSGGPINTVSPEGAAIENSPAVVPDSAKVNMNNDLLTKIKEVKAESLKMVERLQFVEGVVAEQKVRLACMPAIWPTRGYLTSAYGYRIHPFTGMREFHKGIDIATQSGNGVLAAANGTVLIAEFQNFLGNVVVIDHGFGYQTWYAHLSSFKVREGERVNRRQLIGLIGTTGRSNAPHLHYEVRFLSEPQNPFNYILDEQ